MSSTQDAKDAAVTQQNPFLPDELESNEPPLESDLHFRQIILLLQCLESWWRDRSDFYACGNMTIYFNPDQLTNKDFRGPDFFVVLGTTRRPRKSWMVWREGGKFPNVIVELLSDSTARVDRGLKKKIYQNRFRTPEYFWFDPHSLEFQGFRLVRGRYVALQPNTQGWLWSQELELYLGIYEEQLRFFTPQAQLIQSPVELAEQEAQRAEQEAQRAEQERQRADRLAEKLRELNIDPSQF